MTAKELIKYLQGECDPNDIVVIGEPEGPGWANIDRIRCEIGSSTVDIIPEQYPIFSDN